MVSTQSTMQQLGAPATDFSLPDVSNSNQQVSLSDFADKPLLIFFICNHCPYVIHVIDKLAEVANDYQSKGFGVVAISANDIENYPQDGPEHMATFATQYGFAFPYCFDQSQAVAKAYGAACTPDFYIYDKQHELSYRGQMDAARPSNSAPVTAKELIAAMDATLTGEPPVEPQHASMGCNIKWRAGNAPDYF